MIRTKLFAAGAAFCMLGMTGCSNDMVEEDGTQAGKQVTMTLQGTTDSPQTRADYTEDVTDLTKMNFSWRSGDKLSMVVDGTTADNCELTTTTDGKSAPFSGTVATFSGTKTIYAFYPYSATPYAVTGGDNKETATATLTLPVNQLYTIGGAISNSFMVGVGSATANGDAITASASLKQVMSIIKLNITNASAKVTGVKLKCTDAIFATTATVKLSDATITNPDNLVNELSMTVTDNSIDPTATKTISFAIFPKAKVDGKKIQIEVTYEDGISKMIEKDDIAFARNMHYVMGFDYYIVVGNLKVAVGNLVADGANGAKIGTATDGGLYFQFGSLVGWSTPDNPIIAVKPAAFNGQVDWTAPGKTWQGKTGTVPFTTLGSKEEKAGIGDPCRYYLGEPWRLPTTDEYKTLFGANGWNNGWFWADSPALAIHAGDGLIFPAVGNIHPNGYLSNDRTGYCWSASPDGGKWNWGSYMLFSKNYGTTTFKCPREYGLPVRCVQKAN